MNLLSHLSTSSRVALGALLSTAAIGHAQSVLLSAGDFTLLGGTAITSTGVDGTVISNGDIGLSPGATTGITGFPPAIVANGAIIATGPVTGQARLDLITVSTALALINPGAANGADYGLFWNAGTAVNIGANNTVAGNYLAGTSVIFGGLSFGGARALALAAVTLDNNQIDALGGPCGGDWTGGLEYNAMGAIVPSTTVPEPSTYAALAGSVLLSFAILRRRRGVARS